MAAARASGSADALAGAFLAERDARQRQREARTHLAALVHDAVTAGTSYDELARLSLRPTMGRSATPAERRREAVRLRKLVHRHRVTSGHGYPQAVPGMSPGPSPPSIQQGGLSMGNPKLISRKTVEETFVDSDEDERLDDIDDLEGEDERNEDEHEPPRAARPRR